MGYIDVQKRMTQKFIDMDPFTVVLIPTVRTAQPSGSWTTEDGDPRPAQTFKLNTIEFTPRQGVPTITQDGVEHVIGAYLIGTLESIMDVGDHWTGADGRIYTIIALMDGHGYERKAAVEAHGH